MIHFALAIGPPGSCATLGERLREAVDDTTLLGGESVDERSPTDSWRLAAVAAPDAFLHRRWYADREELVVCNGGPTGPAAERQPSRMLERYRDGGSDAVAQTLRGAYNLVCLTPGRGLEVRGDFAGVYPLYHGRHGEVLVLSNRATTVSQLVADGGWDLGPLAWVIGHGALDGLDVPPRDAALVPVGEVGRASWGSAELTSRPAPDRPWPPADGDGGRPTLSPSEWDAVTDALVDEVRSYGDLSTPLYLGLTGGKDSRLVLALLKAAGMTEVETYTSGGSMAGEVACAADVARAAGFVHHEGSPLTGAGRRVVVPGPVALEEGRARLWHRAAQAALRYDGIVSIWSGIKNATVPGSLVLNGWGGELYRRGRLRWRDGRRLSRRGLSYHLRNYEQVFDPLGLLLPEERHRQTAAIDRWVADAAADIRLDLVPDAFYLRRRVAHWAGPLTQDLPARITAVPLLSPVAARKCAELTALARGSERLHFEVMRRTAPELLGLPFLGDVWSWEIRRDTDVELARAPFGATPKRQTIASGLGRRIDRAKASTRATRYVAAQAAVSRFDRRFGLPGWSAYRRRRGAPTRNPGWPLVAEHGDEVDALLVEAADAGLSGVCDVDLLRAVLRQPDRVDRGDEQLQVMSSIGVALLLTGRGERVVHEGLAPT